jgi:CRP-like cAMP-binding protein
MSGIDLSKNALLNRLSADDQDRLRQHLTVLDLEKGSLLFASSANPRYSWFPTGPALGAFVIRDDDGKATEVCQIGHEGVIGAIVSDGNSCAFPRAVVRAGGRFLRIDNGALDEIKEERSSVRRWLNRYADCLLAQVFQEAYCGKSHSVVQRTAKWLLDAQDRTGSAEIAMTQENLAELLGVGRSFVNRVVHELRAEGLIETRRSVLRIRDEKALRAKSCDCHSIVSNHFKRMFGEAPGCE